MCGRYTLHQRAQSLKEHYNVKHVPHGLKDNYNVAPGQFMPVVTLQDNRPTLDVMKWGLVPAWAKDPKIGYKLINARDDTIFTKPMWRSVILKQRCLIPVDGFYEWQKVTVAGKEQKQPFYIKPKHDDLLDLRKTSPPLDNANDEVMVDLSGGSDAIASLTTEKLAGRVGGVLEEVGILRKSSLFSFAGVWSAYKDVEGLEWNTYSIITTSPNKEMASIHNRMPVILHQKDEVSWLEPSVQTKENLEHFLRPYEDDELEIYEVSRDVNVVQNNNIELTYPIDY